MYRYISLSQIEDGIAHLHIDDAANQNRLSEELSSEISSALDALAHEPKLRVLLMHGRSDVFCAGATLTQLRKMTAGEMPTNALSLPEQMIAFPLPIIGAIEGHAVGGGLALALCCDMTIAAESSRYGANFTELGFTPGMGLVSLLPAQVGHAFACEMLLGAKLYKGRELLHRGLFNEVVPADRVMALAEDHAYGIAAKPRDVVMMVKEALAIPRRRALADVSLVEKLMHRASFNNSTSKELIESVYLS